MMCVSNCADTLYGSLSLGGHGANKSDDGFHVLRIHVGEGHAAFLHLDTVMAQKIFKDRRGKNRGCAGQWWGGNGSGRSTNAMTAFAGVALEDFLSAQSERAERNGCGLLFGRGLRRIGCGRSRFGSRRGWRGVVLGGGRGGGCRSEAG